MTIRGKMALRLLSAVCIIGLLSVTQIAAASHLRPKGATPVITSLVPAFQPCPNSAVTSPNSTHAPPLAFRSCKPPLTQSAFLTTGTPDVNGAAANLRGFVRIDVCPVPGCRQGDGIRMHVELMDVRCKPGTAGNVCNSPNGADGPDYSGDLQSDAMIRITDHLNGPEMNEAATVVDIPFPVNVPCANTADTTTGGFCSFDTSTSAMQPLIPVPQTSTPMRAVVELTQLLIKDGGADGVAATQGNTLFAIQGFFIP